MSSHADRFSAARDRAGDRKSGLLEFQERLGFVLDAFQVDACRAVASSQNVLVCAPTGSGKTVVAEYAADLCQEQGTRLFYTTPIKALSNQKFQELRSVHGEDAVGLLTGDNSINSDANLVVMTTEVLRNMIYAEHKDLHDLSTVVMDEVHYLADRNRGPVWEETLIHLPAHVQVIALSATISNAEEFAGWLREIRGATTVVTETHRPVPLHHEVLYERRIIDISKGSGKVNPELVAIQKQRRESVRWGQSGSGASGSRSTRYGRTGAGHRNPSSGSGKRSSRPENVEILAQANLLPAITFVFSRNGCDAAVEQCLDAGVRLTSGAERLEIRDFVELKCRFIPDEDLSVLGYLHWREALEAGIAAHHAGLIPVFKETIEALFQRGLIKVVFATETLALGVNMPAKSVLLERLVKWNGDAHVSVTAGEYTQLTGRAGRRGIDNEGHALVAFSDELDLPGLAAMASSPSFPLRSAFAASYNMVVNLIRRYGIDEARIFNEKSFAQFQADSSQHGLAATMTRNEAVQDDLETEVSCHLGDFDAYATLADRLSKVEKAANAASRSAANASVNTALEALRVGDVIEISRGRRQGRAVVISAARVWPPRVAVLGADRQVRRVGMGEFLLPPTVLGHITINSSFTPRSANARKSLATELVRFRVLPANVDQKRDDLLHATSESDIASLRAALKAHPCHGCHDRASHLSTWHNIQRLKRENSQLEAKISGRRSALSKRFNGLCRVLTELGYIEATEDLSVLPAGELLSGMHTELDLLTAEVVRRGTFDSANPAAAAAIAAALTYEARGDDETAVVLPTEEIRQSMMEVHRAWAAITEVEAAHGLQPTRSLDYGMVPPIFRWATGAPLIQVLAGQTFLPGDFVRWCRQSIDLLRHIANSDHASTSTRRSAHAAVRAIDRDIVRVSTTEDPL